MPAWSSGLSLMCRIRSATRDTGAKGFGFRFLGLEGIKRQKGLARALNEGLAVYAAGRLTFTFRTLCSTDTERKARVSNLTRAIQGLVRSSTVVLEIFPAWGVLYAATGKLIRD
jgi:hypothetical protein